MKVQNLGQRAKSLLSGPGMFGISALKFLLHLGISVFPKAGQIGSFLNRAIIGGQDIVYHLNLAFEYGGATFHTYEVP